MQLRESSVIQTSDQAGGTFAPEGVVTPVFFETSNKVQLFLLPLRDWENPATNDYSLIDIDRHRFFKSGSGAIIDVKGDSTMKTGDVISDFALKDQNAKFHNLSAYKGKRVLLSFRPLAWTPI